MTSETIRQIEASFRSEGWVEPKQSRSLVNEIEEMRKDVEGLKNLDRMQKERIKTLEEQLGRTVVERETAISDKHNAMKQNGDIRVVLTEEVGRARAEVIMLKNTIYNLNVEIDRLKVYESKLSEAVHASSFMHEDYWKEMLGVHGLAIGQDTTSVGVRALKSFTQELEIDLSEVKKECYKLKIKEKRFKALLMSCVYYLQTPNHSKPEEIDRLYQLIDIVVPIFRGDHQLRDDLGGLCTYPDFEAVKSSFMGSNECLPVPSTSKEEVKPVITPLSDFVDPSLITIPQPDAD